MSLATVGSIISDLWKPVILPLLSLLVGWLAPSPIQNLLNKQKEIKSAEDAASGPNPDSTGLDKLP